MSLPARIALSALRRPATHRYSRDQRSQVAELHVPSGAGPFPIAVVLHGGYWRSRYGKLVTRPLAHDLVRRGWAAWNLEYRRVGRHRGGWPMTFDDVATGIDHLATLGDPRLDLQRVHAVGHSAGGHLALWAASRPDPTLPLRSVVALAPVTDLRRTGEPAAQLLGGTPSEVPDRWALADPLAHAPLPLPVLIVHPVADETIPIARSRTYTETARAAGGDVELVESTTGGHRDVIDPTNPGWHAAANWLTNGRRRS